MKVHPDGTPFNSTDTTNITQFFYNQRQSVLSASLSLMTSRPWATRPTPVCAWRKWWTSCALPGDNLTYTVTFINDSSSDFNLK